MSASLLAILALFAQVGGGAPYRPNDQSRVDANGDPVFSSASITAEEDSIVAAEAEGTLLKIAVNEGDRVNDGTVLATIDDRQAKAAVDVAKLTLDAATERANDEVEEQYAILAAKVAKVDWEMDIETNKRVPNSVAPIQVLQKELVFDRSNLQIEKARKDQVIAKKEAAVKGAELEAADIGLARRTIKAPFDGEVQQLFQKEAQWVNPGDPILRLVKFDVLRVESYVNASQFDPVELAGKPVTIKVRLARDREVSLPGRITYVGQTVRAVKGDYLVRAEIQNQRSGDYWLIRPGLLAEMTIHVSQPAEPQARGAAIPAK
ncbi:efflux RND transporter periplasmic adaptor subunit [Lacipirellula limnantheis]|uniref:Multidrug resistance protein MdtN n=1 Tax=Lacipirellula limnantheis TaxID=2528024 RepID=A0A517U5D4_9BACT|nr:HlyD family efflux transporter periplasmic adaptor subunit [Lacipirellula limnantheis]QDT75827.1 multidrug resistance protein MdtN [Lacipirellula limnantheis]